MRTASFFIAFILFFVLTGCKKQQLGTPGTNEVWLEYQAFNPTQMVITAGTTITFTNKDNQNHTATSSGLFDSGTLKSGNTYTFKFNTKGTYFFFCNFHSTNNMEQGYILVQ